MRSVQDHLADVLASIKPVDRLDVVLHDAAGCVLGADVVGAIDSPPMAVADCDGYAVIASDTRLLGTRTLPVSTDVAVADTCLTRLVPGQAVRIASGARLPAGADAVIPLARTDRGEVSVTVPHDVQPGEHVRVGGHHARAGEVLLAAGMRLGARQIGLAAAVGRSRLVVHPTPRVVLVSVGNELVEPGNTLGEGQRVEVNRYCLEAAVRDAGGTPIRAAILGDDRAQLRESLEDQLVRADMVITTGGLSEMIGDTVKDVLPTLGDFRLDDVAMSPRTRFGMGMAGPASGFDRNIPVLALPGDPAAALIAFEVFVRPALRTMCGQSLIYRPSVSAAVSRGWQSPPGVRQFVPATVVGDPETGYEATILGDPADPRLTDLARADALVVVSETEQTVNTGRMLSCLVLEG